MWEVRSGMRRPEWRESEALRIAMLRCVFSISTVASSTRMPTARASPPRVITLMVWPNRLSTDKRSENRQRNGDADDDRAPNASQEQQNHQPSKTGGDQSFAENASNGRANEDRLIGQSNHLELWRNVRKNSLESRL